MTRDRLISIIIDTMLVLYLLAAAVFMLVGLTQA